MNNEKIESRIAVLIYLPAEVSLSIQNAKNEVGISYPNHETQLPHITLYTCKFEESKYSDLVAQLADIKFKPFYIKIGKLSSAKQSKNQNIFVSLGFDDTSTLQELHEEVLMVSNKLRGDLVRSKDIERYKAGILSEEEFVRIQEYGYQYVKNYFDPHITIGEIEEGKIEIVENLNSLLKDIEGKEIKVDKINVILSRRMVPEEKKVSESKLTEILLID